MKVTAPTNQINNYNTFKSVYPVVHWVAEANGSYAPIANLKLVSAFQEKIISCLNSNPILTPKEIKELTKAKKKVQKEILTADAEKLSVTDLKKIIDIPSQYLRAYIGGCDAGYRTCTSRKNKVRSFYDRVTKDSSGYIPVSYIISGEHVADFNRKFGEEIGRSIRQYGKDSEEVKKAKSKYNHKGLDYVKDYTRRKKDEQNRTQVLHTKFEVVRNSDGEFTGYRFVDARFLPEFGPESPFEKLKRR